MEYVFSRRRIVVSIVCSLVFIITSTACMVDYTKRPWNFRPSKWSCEDPYILLEYDYNDSFENYGETQFHGDIITFRPEFDHGNRVLFSPLDSNYYGDILFIGRCRFSSKKLIIYQVEKDLIFDNQYETIVITRVE